VCRAHLRQWAAVFFMYTADNDNTFWTEHNVWATGVEQGSWMPMLSKSYGDVDEFRLCPSANKLNGPQGGVGTTFRQWGPGPIMINHQFGPDASKNYGSYGTNLWINSVDPPSTMGWRGQPERQWKKLQSKYAADIPTVGDCTWFGTNPISIRDNSWANGGDPAPSEDWWEQQDPINFGYWGYDMARLTINRHSRAINMSFMDGSTRKVILHDLWSLKWHRGYENVYDIKIPWLK
jgi:prepilin-type processing-associated H-X9-DG protein